MPTAVFTHDDCVNHVTPTGHPERVARYETVSAALDAIDGLDRRAAPLCDDAALLLAHPASHVAAIVGAEPADGWASLDPDTHMSPGSVAAARRAVGGVVAAVGQVLDGGAGNAFVGCRPPGHHAEHDRAMGFCLFSNAAIGALHALDAHGLARVAVVDFDVHHGNGSQNVLWGESRALYASSHEMPLYPGSGAVSERGGSGNVVNAPLPGRSGSAEMRSAWSGHILPAVAAFAPDLIIVSAGFDAHAADPLASLNWRTDDFAWVTRAICETADRVCGGRLVSTLEGGYDLQALGAGVAAHVEVLKEHAG